jgi:hypothetical protein
MKQGLVLARNLLLGIFLFFILLVTAVFMLQQHSPMPLLDAWRDTVPLYFHYLNHTLTFHQVMAGHNLHRLVLLRLFFLTYAHFLPHYPIFIFWCSYLLTLSSTCFLFWVYSKQSGGSTKNYLMFMMFVFLMFSPAAYRIWVWQFLFQFPLTIFFVVLAFFVTAHLCSAVNAGSWRTIFFVIMLCFLATLSTANGLAVWPIVTVLLLIYRVEWPRVLAFFSIGVLTIGMYLRHNSSGGAVIANKPLESLHYFFNFLSNIFAASVFPQNRLYAIVGLLALLFFIGAIIMLVKRRGFESLYTLLPWLALSCFVFACAATGSIFRLFAGGAVEAMSSRYAVYTALFYVAFLVVVEKAWPCFSKVIRWLYVLFFVLLFSLLVRSFYCLIFAHLFVGMSKSVYPSQLALRYKVMLPLGHDVHYRAVPLPGGAVHFEGNYYVMKSLARYYRSSIYSLGSPTPNWLNKNYVLSSGYVSIIPKQAVLSYLQGQNDLKLKGIRKPFGHIAGFQMGDVVSGLLSWRMRPLFGANKRILLLDAKGKVCGIAIATPYLFTTVFHIPIPFAGFKLFNCNSKRLVWAADTK